MIYDAQTYKVQTATFEKTPAAYIQPVAEGAPYIGTDARSGGSGHPADILLALGNNKFIAYADRDPLSGVTAEIERLRGRPSGWNGYDVDAPDPAAVDHARSVIFDLWRTTERGLWRDPHVTADAYGNVVLEWSSGPRSIDITVLPDSLEFTRIHRDKHGRVVDADEACGAITIEAFAALWRWFTAD